MKKIFLTFTSLIIFTFTHAQSDKDFANVYIKRSQESLNNFEVKTALIHFDKALKYIDTIQSANVAKLGTLIYYELEDLAKAKSFAQQYFVLVKNKESDEYYEFLELYVNITEDLDIQLAKEKLIEDERIKEENALKRIDSLKTSWQNKAKSLTIHVDSIYAFNKYNLALYAKDNYYGIISDKGEVVVKANKYKSYISFDGYVIFEDKELEPTKLYCYNTIENTGFLLPSPFNFNALSTHYGKVMLPRGNGLLVAYLNKSFEPMVYDLNLKKSLKVDDKEKLFKKLKNNGFIDKYNNDDDEVRINRIWYKFGGHLGGGMYPLYFSNIYQVNSYLCSTDGRVLDGRSDYEYLGAFYDNKFQAIKDHKTSWIDQNGTEVTAPKDVSKGYKGKTKVVKLTDGTYQLMEEGFIILGDKKLEKLEVFLRDNAKK